MRRHSHTCTHIQTHANIFMNITQTYGDKKYVFYELLMKATHYITEM